MAPPPTTSPSFLALRRAGVVVVVATRKRRARRTAGISRLRLSFLSFSSRSCPPPLSSRYRSRYLVFSRTPAWLRGSESRAEFPSRRSTPRYPAATDWTRLRYGPSRANPKYKNVTLNSPRSTNTKFRHSDSCPTTGTNEAYRYSWCLKLSYVPHKLSCPITESSTRVRARKKNSIGARGRRSIAWCTLYIDDDPLSLPVSFPARPRGFYRSPGFVTLSSAEFSEGPSRSNVQLPSSISKRQKNESYIFHGLFRIPG